MLRFLQFWALRRCFSLEDLEWEVLTRKVLAVEKSFPLRDQQLVSKKQQERTTEKKSKKSLKALGLKGRVPRGAQPTSSGLATLPSGEIVIPTRGAHGHLTSYDTPNGIGGVANYPSKPIPSGSIFKTLKEWGTRD
jgi:hypothetical protein